MEYHFISLEERVGFGLSMAFRAVEPFLTWDMLICINGLQRRLSLQQGDLIETCALRMCLLQE